MARLDAPSTLSKGHCAKNSTAPFGLTAHFTASHSSGSGRGISGSIPKYGVFPKISHRALPAGLVTNPFQAGNPFYKASDRTQHVKVILFKADLIDIPKNFRIMQTWTEPVKSVLPICNYSQILY